ncbi:MAG: TonB-dependent receptor plug domain-containing protein [Bacteroidota bacterium]
MKRISIIILTFFVIIASSEAQEKQDTIILEAVSIQEQRSSQMNGVNRQRMDSIDMQLIKPLSLSATLASHSPVFIKSYGQGALSTSSFRGAGASHTQVLWNGVNINSPTLGQTDFSLIPMNIMDQLTLLKGGNSIFSTSGGLGGAIHLDNEANWSDSLTFNVNQEISSLKGSKTSVENNFITGKLLINTRLFHIQSENEYTYKNNTKGKPPYPEETQKNAAYRQSGLMENIHYKIDRNNTLSARIWAQSNFRELPRPLTVKDMKRNEEQSNEFVRTQLSWENQKGKDHIFIRTAWFDESYTYKNPVAGLQTTNKSRLFSTHAAYKYYISSDATIETGLNSDLYNVQSSGYEDNFTRNHLSAFSSFMYRPWTRLQTLWVIRAEKINNKKINLLPSASLKFSLLKPSRLIWMANFSRNYHYPTMNDKYWNPGGNPGLEAEYGNSYETGLQYKNQYKQKKLLLEASATYYYSSIHNWILWQPDSVASYWTPSNLKKVHSQGIETGLTITKKYGNSIFRLNTQYTFTSTKNAEKLYPGDASLGKQLIYVPKHSGNVMAFVNYKQWNLIYKYNYTGKRYTTSDNSRYMPDFMLHDLEIGKTWELNKTKLSTSIRVDNILNTDYQSVAWYPMPGRVFHLKLGLIWKRN